MKIMTLIVFTAVLLAGCSTTEEESTEAEQQEQATTTNQEDSQESTNEPTTDAEEEQEAEEAPVYHVNEANWTVQTEENEKDEVLLTFDDAPDGNAVQIAEILAAHEVPAIFFVNGMFLQEEDNRRALQEISDMGFAIGNHTTTHPSLPDLSEDEQREELAQTDELVQDITGDTPSFFRAPFGQNTSVSDAYAEEHGMVKMNWTYGYDFEAEYQDPEALTDITLNTELLTDGANILMHDRTWTKDALDDIILGFEEKGYSFIDPDYIEKQ